MSDLFRRVLAVTLASLLLFPMTPVRAQTATEAPASQADTYAASDVSSSTLSVASSATAANGLKAPEVPVSAQGNYQTSIPVHVPPGRAGMQPSLALTYDSGSAKQASAVGAGWSFGVGEVSRSTSKGYPKISRATSTLKYADDANEGALFSWNGLDLAEVPATAVVPDRVWANSRFYAAMRGTDAAMLEYSVSNNAWVAHRPDGRKQAFGRDPRDLSDALVVNELGTFRWLLVREWNANGDRVIYRYYDIEQQARSDKTTWQDEPILKTVAWGGNDKVAGADPFLVVTTLKSGKNLETSALRGNVRVGSSLVQSVSVCGPVQTFAGKSGVAQVGVTETSGACSGKATYRNVALAYDESLDTSRSLLRSVTESVPGVTSTSWSSNRIFQYTSNAGVVSFLPPRNLVQQGAPELGTLGVREQRANGVPPTASWTEAEAQSPYMSSVGTRFMDVNGDGRSDVLYHPSGLNSPASRVLDVVHPFGQHAVEGVVYRFPLYGGADIARSAVQNGPGSYGSFDFGNLDPDVLYSDVANLDSDGVADGLFFTLQESDFPARSGGGQCFSGAFWSMCGVIDPYGEPPADMCDFDSSCEELSTFDVSMCSNGSCWIDESLLVVAFEDVHDWAVEPPSSGAGLSALAEHGISVSSDGLLYGVSESELRGRLALELANFDVFEDSFWKLAAATSPANLGAMCSAMMDWCQATRIGPAVRVEVEWDRSMSCTPAERAAASLLPSDSNVPGIECKVASGPAGRPRLRAAAMRLGVHSSKTQQRDIAHLPLELWPSKAGKTVFVGGTVPGPTPDSPRLPPYKSSIVDDFVAPILDINGDGRADIVLLKSVSQEIDGSHFEFSPRAYLQEDADRRYDDYDFFFRSDWSKGQVATTGDIADGSDFTESLNQVLVGNVDFGQCPYGVCWNQEQHRFLIGAGYNALFQDVNADGLPDLVVGRADAVSSSCSGSGACSYSRASFNANPGHDVFINRGYRFGVNRGVSLPGRDTRFNGSASSAVGPWEKILKGALQPQGTEARPSGEGLIPLQVTSMADINADGRGDVVAWYRPRTPGASATSSIELKLWLNTGDSYVEKSPDSLRQLASSNRLDVDVPGLTLGEALTGQPGAQNEENIFRALMAGDLARFEDVNDDGLVDIYIPGEVCGYGTCVDQTVGGTLASGLYPSRVMYNAGVHPDMLVEVSEASGLLTTIDYAAARVDPMVVAPSDYVPSGKIVASHVEISVSSDAHRSIGLSYGSWMRAKSAGVSLGFEHVSANVEYASAGGTRDLIATTYYSDDPEADYARRGLVVREEVEADDDFSVTESAYKVVRPYSGVVRLDLDESTSTSCQISSGLCVQPVVSRREIVRRNEFGLVEEVVEGDYTSGVFSDEITSHYSYDTRSDIWSLGLVSSVEIVGQKFGLEGASVSGVLQQQTAKYDALGRLVESVDVDVTSAACGALDGVFKVISFDVVGNPTVVLRNGSQIETTYDVLRVYPAKILAKVASYVDGNPSGTFIDLASQQQVDVRSGQVWTSTDPNGAILEQQYDGIGRKTNSYDANGALTSSVTYDLYGTRSSEVAWFSTTAGRKVLTTTDAFGNVVKRISYDRSNGVDSRPIRLEFNVVDTEGVVYRAYLPEMTAADPTVTSPATIRVFDASGRMIHQTSPGNRIVTAAYTPRTSIVTDPLGVVTKTANDWRGSTVLVEKSNPAFPGVVARSKWARDGLGRLVQLTDADSSVQRFEYDNGSHLTQWTLPHPKEIAASGTFSQCFDAEGNVTAFSDPDGRTVQTSYDMLSRPVVVNVKDDLSATPVKYTMSYDKAGSNRLGRQWRSTDPLGSTEQVYDANGRPTTALRVLTTALGGIAKLTTVSTWGQQGEVKTTKVYGGDTTAPLIGDLSLTYSGAGRVSSVKDGTTELVGGLAFDAFEKPTTFKVGATPTVVADRITAVINRDAATRDLTGLAYGRPGRVLTSLGLAGYNGYGAPGVEERTGTSDSVGSGVSIKKGWNYDGFGRLKEEKVSKSGTVVFNEAYTYSLGGRLLTAGGAAEIYKYNRSDLPGAVTDVLAAAPRTLTYYNSGAVKTDKKGTETRTASFSALGCLRRFKSTTGAMVEQVCDVAGNPLLRTSTTAAGVKTTVMNFGFSELRSEDKLMVHRIPVAGLVTMELAYATTGGRKDGASKIIMSDGRGSVLAVAPLLGTTGANVDGSQDFDAWGKPIAIGAAKPKHGYVDHEPDAVFGTYAFGRRVYDPQLRRWLSADPLIGANPEVDINQNTQLDLWGYTSNPVARTDRSGMVEDADLAAKQAFDEKNPGRELTAEDVQDAADVAASGAAALVTGGKAVVASGVAVAVAVKDVIVGEVTTYWDFKKRSPPGDNLEGHELWQHANQKSVGAVDGRRLSNQTSKDNPVIALPKPIHQEVSRRQLAFDAEKATPLENIRHNAQILRDIGVVPSFSVDLLETAATDLAISLGYDK